MKTYDQNEKHNIEGLKLSVFDLKSFYGQKELSHNQSIGTNLSSK